MGNVMNCYFPSPKLDTLQVNKKNLVEGLVVDKLNISLSLELISSCCFTCKIILLPNNFLCLFLISLQRHREEGTIINEKPLALL